MADPYVTADGFREARSGNATQVSDDLIEDLVAEFEDLAERYVGVAFTTRSVSEVQPAIRGVVELSHREVVSVSSVQSLSGAPVHFELFDKSMGRVRVSAAGEVEVTYSHGVALPPAIRQACLDYVERSLVADRSGQSRDLLSQAFDGGTTRYSTPDWSAGRPTGMLDVDQRLNYFRDRYLIRVA